MDKVGTYSENLEKGCSEAQPLPSESYHACSAHPTQIRRRRSLAKHPWIIFGAVALTWLLFSHGKRLFSQPHHTWHWADHEVEYASLTEGDAHQCVRSTNWTTYLDQPPWAPEHPYGAEATFSLPLDSDVLYLGSRGPFQYGLVNIEQSSEVADTVDVHVRVAYYDGEALEHATVCRTERADKEHGVGIFTSPIVPHPPHRAPEDQLRFDVTLILPAGKDAPLSVKKLNTKMPNYNQNVADLQESVFFDSISLTSANGLLNVKSVAFEAGRFSAVNGKIDGHFSARSSLDLNTVNGGIAPTVNLFHREGKGPPKLTIHSVNGQVDAEVSLTSEALVGGEFEVNAGLKNGNIGLKFADTPVDSVLRCHAETISGGVEVGLDSAFEGTYSLQSILGKKLVSQHNVDDPAGKDRQRVISLNEALGRVEGELRWVESDGSSSENEGYVILKAVTASLKLVV